jgi:YbgC/YbaW family acyl-CoA thioester hydrolase
MKKRNEFRFAERLRVRWAEVDPRKAVFNAHYLMYLDTAMTGYWRALGVPCEETLKYLGGELSVSRATLDFRAPARLDDVLDIGIACNRIDNASIVFDAAVFRQDQVLASAELAYAFADADTQGAKRVPPELRELLQGFEAGRPMVDVRVGAWDVLGADARAIRTSVFVQEQGIPEAMEWDNADSGCVHAVAYNHFGVPLATGRLIEHVPGVAKIGRMAVAQAVRGSGVGRSVLDALMKAARERGYREAVMHAQVSAAPFYGRAGFVARGSAFDEVGIPHIEMVCDL